MPIYNYLSRQNGFLNVMNADHTGNYSNRIVSTGSSIDEVYRFMKNYLQKEKLPEAFIMESYHVSIGTIRAMQELGIRIPEDVSLVGIDALPDYLTGGKKLTCIRIPHTERAYWTVQLLLNEINRSVPEKATVYINCILIDGNTVAKRHG